MERYRYVRDGKVAIVCTNRYGAGWSSQNENYAETLLFHPKIVEMVIQGKENEMDEKWFMDNLGWDSKTAHDLYLEGRRNLYIDLLPEGTFFTVEEYDGLETIKVINVPENMFRA